MTKNETFNGPRDFPISGHYFELLSTVNPVDVQAFAEDGRIIADEKQVSTNYYIDRKGVDPFVRILVTTGALEAVKFTYTDGHSGTKAASNDLLDRAGRLVGIVYGTLGQVAQELLNGANALVVACKGTLGTLAQVALGGVNALQVTERGFSYGGSYASTTALAAGGTSQVFSAAQNPNGAIVWAAGVGTSAGAANSVGLIAKATAPATLIDGDVILKTTSTGANFQEAVMPRAVFVAAGKGLFFISGTLENNAYRNVLFTLL